MNSKKGLAFEQITIAIIVILTIIVVISFIFGINILGTLKLIIPSFNTSYGSEEDSQNQDNLQNPKCQILTISWNKITAKKNEEVELIAIGKHCENEKIVFKIYEDDIFKDDLIKVGEATFNDKIAKYIWKVGQNGGGIFKSGRGSEYYFKIEINTKTLKLKSDQLKIK
ncbi:MAG: hypothetical protein QW727_00630 [Candidatus Pacearchaeota archaeon]